MCLYPIYIRNKKYTPNKKNGFIAPILRDQRVGYVAVGCGVCEECRKKRGNEWRVRLNEEIKHNKEHAVFVTLTLSDYYWDELHGETGNVSDEVMLTFAIRRFKERVRKRFGKMPKMWLIQEYGEDYDRVHLHGLIWGMKNEEIEKDWKYGFVHSGNEISEKTVNYIVKYCLKTDEKRPNWKPKIWCSPGIGSQYNTTFVRFKGNETNDIYRCQNGAKVALPIYYRNKIYTENEREKLWIRTIEKETRYIYGARYSISTQQGLERWKEALKNCQKINERKGFGYLPEYWNRKNANNLNINNFKRNLYNSIENCIFASEPKNTDINERSKNKLRNVQMHETLAKYNNVGDGNYNRDYGTLQKTDATTWIRLCNNRDKRSRETDRKNSYIQTKRNKTTIINNLNNYNNVDSRIKQRKSLSSGDNYGMREMGEESIHTGGYRTHRIQMGENVSIREGRTYEIIDIDTGEIYTKVEYTKIKNQLKTINYEKRKEFKRNPDGSKRTVWRTKRFVQQCGKEQYSLFP